jgi:integrase
VRVRAGKTGARTVVAPAEAWEVVGLVREQHPNPAPDAKLWVTLAGAEVTTFRASFMAVLRELGMLCNAEGNRRSLYSLRHSYITDRLSANTPIDKLAKNAGTSIQQIEQHYGHVLIENHAADLAKPLGGHAG